MYDEYDFTEPWNGPNNRKLGKTRLTVFECPSVRHRGVITDYVAVTGPHTAWPGDKATAVEDFSDGTSKTILLVELANSDIHWMEPRDLTLDEVLSTGPQSWQAVANHDRTEGYFVVRRWAGAHVAFADGAISLLTRPFPDDLETLFTIDDGKPAELNYEDLGRPVISIHWPHCVGLAIFIISLILLLSRPLPKAWIEPPRNACDCATD